MILRRHHAAVDSVGTDWVSEGGVLCSFFFWSEVVGIGKRLLFFCGY